MFNSLYKDSKLYCKERVLDLRNKIPPKGPDFFIVGASRSGSTYLHYMIKNHPDVFMPATKEVHYFNKDTKYRQNLLGYRSHFYGYNGEKTIGEVTPFYLYANMLYDTHENIQCNTTEDSIKRIHTHFPQAKIVISLRNPYKRIISMFQKNFYQGKITRDLSSSIKEEIYYNTSPNLVYRNKYDIHIKNILKYFPQSSLKILLFEEWINDREIACREMCDFLKLDYKSDYALNVPKGKNKARKYEQNKSGNTGEANTFLDAEAKQILLDELEPGKIFVEDMLQNETQWTI